MKGLIRFAVAGALVAAAQASFAQSVPSSNSGDLWLFVSDQAAGTTFAEDTGVLMSSLLPTSELAPSSTGASLSTSISANIDVSESPALAAYIAGAATAGQSLEWAVEGANYNGSPANTVGSTTYAFSSVPDYNSVITGYTYNGAVKTLTGAFNGDISYLLNGSGVSYTTGGTSYAFNNPNASSQTNVWGASTGNNGGSTNLYGQGVDQSGNALGSTVSLYGLTGNGGAGKAQSYDLSNALTLTAGGVLETASPVPLPAAVWLFGSGLLGLMGVGRRRSTAV